MNTDLPIVHDGPTFTFPLLSCVCKQDPESENPVLKVVSRKVRNKNGRTEKKDTIKTNKEKNGSRQRDTSVSKNRKEERRKLFLG